MSRQGTLLRGCPPSPHLPPRSRISFNTFPLRRQEEVERDGEPVSNPTLATRSVVNVPGTITEAWGLIIRRILVRAEYEETERTVLEANELGIEAFLVGGQPRIGLSPPPPSYAEPTSAKPPANTRCYAGRVAETSGTFI